LRFEGLQIVIFMGTLKFTHIRVKQPSLITGKIMQLNPRWVFVPEGASVEEAIFEGEPEVVEHKPQASRSLILGGMR